MRAKHICSIDVNCQCFEVCSESLTRVQKIKKCCRQFENCRTDIHDDNCTDPPNISETDMRAARVVELVLEDRIITWRIADIAIMRK